VDCHRRVGFHRDGGDISGEGETEAGGYILNPGEYRINLLVAANNMKAESRTIEMQIGDQWSDDGGVEVIGVSS